MNNINGLLKKYMSQIIGALQLDSKLDDASLNTFIENIHIRTYEELIEQKIEPSKQEAFAKEMLEAMKDQALLLDYIKKLGTDTEIKNKLIATINNILVEFINQLKKENYISDKNLSDLRNFLNNTKSLQAIDKALELQNKGISNLQELANNLGDS